MFRLSFANVSAVGGGSGTTLTALLAIRDNEVAAESQGIPVARMKLAVYVVAAFGAGLAGALYFVGNLRISPDAAFSVNWSAFAIFMVVIGGIGRIEGPIVGALIFWALNKFFSDYGTWYLLGLGLLAIVMTERVKQHGGDTVGASTTMRCQIGCAWCESCREGVP